MLDFIIYNPSSPFPHWGPSDLLQYFSLLNLRAFPLVLLLLFIAILLLGLFRLRGNKAGVTSHMILPLILPSAIIFLFHLLPTQHLNVEKSEELSAFEKRSEICYNDNSNYKNRIGNDQVKNVKVSSFNDLFSELSGDFNSVTPSEESILRSEQERKYTQEIKDNNREQSLKFLNTTLALIVAQIAYILSLISFTLKRTGLQTIPDGRFLNGATPKGFNLMYVCAGLAFSGQLLTISSTWHIYFFHLKDLAAGLPMCPKLWDYVMQQQIAGIVISGIFALMTLVVAVHGKLFKIEKDIP